MVRWPSGMCGLLVLCAGGAVASDEKPHRPMPVATRERAVRSSNHVAPGSPSIDAAQAVVNKTCAACHKS